MEKRRTDDKISEILLDEQQASSSKKPQINPLLNDSDAGERLKSASEVAGFIGAIIAIAAGFIVWFQTNTVTGFFIGFLIAVGGTSVSYFMVLLSYSYASIITNAFEQTKILKRLEAQKMTGTPEQSESAKPEQTTAPETVNPVQESTSTISIANPDDEENPDEPPFFVEPHDTAVTALKENWPLAGIIDKRMRRVAHYPERSKHGIICPICNRKQSSDMDKCYYCDCGFIYDDEQIGSTNDILPNHLRSMPLKQSAMF